MIVLRRQCPGRLGLFSTDRLLWVWLYRVWPQVLNALAVVKPATVIQWHRKGLAVAITSSGTIQDQTEIGDLIRQMRDQPTLGCAVHPRRTAQARPRSPTRRMMLG